MVEKGREYVHQSSLKFERSGKYITLNCVDDFFVDDGPCTLMVHDEDKLPTAIIKMDNGEFVDFCDMVRRAHDFVLHDGIGI